MKLDIIYSSPLMRAYKTALAVNKYPQVPVIKDERLIEKYIGELEGKPFSYMTPEEEYCWRHMPHLFIPRGGESQQEVGARAYAALLDLVEKNRGKVIVLAAHGGFFRSLLCILRKIPWERMIEVPEPNNTCVNLVHFYDDGSWEIIYENDTSHLPAAAAAVPVSNWK